jgi:hypothetical protein
VFGGIVNCATIANGVVNACKAIDLHLVTSLTFNQHFRPFNHHHDL